MKWLVFSVLVSLSLIADAAPKAYRIKLVYSKNEKTVFKSVVVVTPGKPGLVTEKTKSGKYFLEVTANEKDEAHPESGVLVKIKAGTVDGKGAQTITANFGVVALEKQEAVIKQISDEPNPQTEAVQVTVTRKK